jgi:hypothetical protein
LLVEQREDIGRGQSDNELHANLFHRGLLEQAGCEGGCV